MPSEAHEAIVAMMRSYGPTGAGAVQAGEFDVLAARKGMETMLTMAPLPDGVGYDPVQAAGMAAEWATPADAREDRVLLYLHGGGYVLGSIATHRGLAARIAQASRLRALLIDYRLAPEHPFPAAVEDATAAYAWLLEQGIPPEKIAIGGDSAGGGLTFATLVALRDAGQALPAAAFALSPWVDLEGLGESMHSKSDADPMIQKADLGRIGRLYLGDADARTPLAAPLYADLTGLPPVYIQVGTAETLLDDATRIAERARLAGVAVEIEPFEDLVHVFQALAPGVPEAVQAIEKIGAYLRRTVVA
jgi:acetyl esterase/lipase